MWFVYVKGMRGPEPEKWSEERGDCDKDGKPFNFLQKIHLNVEMDRYSLAELCQLFPYEGSHECSTDEVQGSNQKIKPD